MGTETNFTQRRSQVDLAPSILGSASQARGVRSCNLGISQERCSLYSGRIMCLSPLHHLLDVRNKNNQRGRRHSGHGELLSASKQICLWLWSLNDQQNNVPFLFAR